jgi:hypothetical protein
VSAESGGRVMMQFNFDNCQSWDSLNDTCPVTLDDSHYPEASLSEIVARNSPVKLTGTELELQGFSIDLGIEVAPRGSVGSPEGSKGGLYSGRALPTFQLTAKPKEDHTYELARRKQTTYQLLIQLGRTPGKVCAILMPKVQITDVSIEPNAEGIARETLSGKAVVPASTDPLLDGVRIYWL